MDNLNDLIDLMKMTAEVVPIEYSSIPEDKLLMNKNKWTVSDHIKHACNSEKGLLWVLNNILEGGEGASKDFDLDKYNASNNNKMNDKTVNDMLDEFILQRKNTLDLIKDITEDKLKLRGRHASQRIFSVAEILLVIAIHPLHHLKAIYDILNNEFMYDDLVDRFTSLFR